MNWIGNNYFSLLSLDTILGLDGFLLGIFIDLIISLLQAEINFTLYIMLPVKVLNF